MLESNKKVHVKVTCDSESIRRVFIFNNIQYCILEKEGKVLEVKKVNDQKKCLSLIFEKTTWFVTFTVHPDYLDAFKTHLWLSTNFNLIDLGVGTGNWYLLRALQVEDNWSGEPV